ncbi:MAG: hypothetical protein IPF62_12185 [Bacteroidetes bacterium]|nr:hypothetical protein [Bacteroidota bacterium]
MVLAVVWFSGVASSQTNGTFVIGTGQSKWKAFWTKAGLDQFIDLQNTRLFASIESKRS